MKKYNTYIGIALFVIGTLIGMWACRTYYVHRGAEIQRDTMYVIKNQSYGKLELRANTHKLKVPKFNIPNFYYIPLDSIKIEYRDSIRYVVLPSESYHTKMGEVDIYHHGIKSEIDSVNVRYRTQSIVNTYKDKDWHHTFSLYGGVGYLKEMRLPVGLQYMYRPQRWFGVGGKIEHDFALDKTGIFVNADITFGW